MSTENYVPVINAPDEYSAAIIKSALEDEGIKTIIEPLNESLAFDGVIALAEGYWGVILVHESDVERARKILDEYAQESIKSDDLSDE